jgi:hypothetical protein
MLDASEFAQTLSVNTIRDAIATTHHPDDLPDDHEMVELTGVQVRHLGSLLAKLVIYPDARERPEVAEHARTLIKELGAARRHPA